MIDVLTIAHFGSALMALLVTGLMAAGFLRLAFRASGLIGHLAMGILLIHGTVFLRTLYRDIAPQVLDEGSLLLSKSGFLGVALVLNVLIVLSGWHGLRALYLAIPERARGRYSLLTAALYPPIMRRR